MPASAQQSSGSQKVWTGIGAGDTPIAAYDGAAVLFNWDGSVLGPATGYDSGSMALDSLKEELQTIESRLKIPADDYRRIYITPQPRLAELERLVCVTTQENGDFIARIYELTTLKLLAELNLNRVQAELYGSSISSGVRSDFYVTCAARNATGDLLLKMSFIDSSTFMTEFGVWTGEQYIPIQLADHSLGSSLTGFTVFETPAVMERIYFGPNAEMLLCQGYDSLSFYRYNPGTGGYDQQQDYDAAALVSLIEQQRGGLVFSLGRIVLYSLALCAVLVLLFLLFRPPRRRRQA